MKGRPARNRILSVLLASSLGVLAVLSACSNNGEGERCETLNGNEDCENGLTCTPARQLPAGFDSADRCCPFDRSQATVASCKQGTSTIGNTPPPADTGPPDTSTSDAADAADAADTSSDAADAADGDADIDADI